MLCISAVNIQKSVGERTLFHIPSLDIYSGERIGLVGPNGCGKTTLLRILAGELTPDAGSVKRLGRVALAMQMGEAGDIDGLSLKRWGLNAGAVKSGGEQTRGRIAAALEQSPHLLLLDEPTASMDAEGVRQLEDELCGFAGAMVIVSHDRDFLDSMTTATWELSPGGIARYEGGYSAYRAAKERERAGAEEAYERYVSKRRQLEEAAAKAKSHSAGMLKAPKRMGNSEARLGAYKAAVKQKKVHRQTKVIEKRIERLEKVEKPWEADALSFGCGALPPVVSRQAVRAQGLSLGYGGRVLLSDADFTIRTGGKAVLIGSNGSGKTTLLRSIAHGDEAVKLAPGVLAGYFAQGFETLDDELSMLENIMSASDLPEHAVRSMLGRVGLRREDAHKKIRVLSGGERVKVQLVRLLAGRFNLLLLDEPGNFLDAAAMDGLQDLLERYTGTLLLVTHDRGLMALCDQVLELAGGRLRAYSGMEERDRAAGASAAGTDGAQAREKQEDMRLELRLAAVAGALATTSDERRRQELEQEYDEIIARMSRGRG